MAATTMVAVGGWAAGAFGFLGALAFAGAADMMRMFVIQCRSRNCSAYLHFRHLYMLLPHGAKTKKLRATLMLSVERDQIWKL